MLYMRQSDGMVITSGEDEYCGVKCICAGSWGWQPDLSATSGWVTRCPKCNRGYRTEFILWVYNPDEKDPAYLDEKEWKERNDMANQKLEEMKKEKNGNK